MVHASVEERWGKNTPLTYTSVNWKVVRDCATTPYSTFCTRIQAGYQVDELLRYSAEGQDSPEYISFHRVERLARSTEAASSAMRKSRRRSVRTRSARMRQYPKDTGMAGLASAWARVRRRPRVPSQGGRGDALHSVCPRLSFFSLLQICVTI